MLKPHDLRHGVALVVLEQHHDLEQVRALLGHARLDTTQVYTTIRPPQLTRAAAFYEEQAQQIRHGVTRQGGGFEKLWNVSRTRGSKH
jgi:integrase/recombinase XerD